MPDLDLVVLGGGLAGLSLAERLAAAGAQAPRTVVLEARADYADDRTWCFWRHEPHRYEELVAAVWRRCAVQRGGHGAVFDCTATPYQMIPAGAFYGHARGALAANPRVRLELDCAVDAGPSPHGAGWRVVAADGRVFEARHVVDTRPPQVRPESILWQSFVGDVVTTGFDAFDPGVAVLMDFEDASDLGVQFDYVLPFSPRQALVETTVFGPRPLGPDALGERHAARVRARLGDGRYAIDRSEHGVLPMGHAQPSEPAGWVRAGLFGGGARASTGYAFLRIQTWADACAAELLRGSGPCAATADPWLRRAMDEVFLRVLRAWPDRGGALLVRLFERADAARVVRFLGDRSGLRDALAVVGALPPGPFLIQALCAALRTSCRGTA